MQTIDALEDQLYFSGAKVLYVPLFSLVYEIRFNGELFFEIKVSSGRIVADT